MGFVLVVLEDFGFHFPVLDLFSFSPNKSSRHIRLRFPLTAKSPAGNKITYVCVNTVDEKLNRRLGDDSSSHIGFCTLKFDWFICLFSNVLYMKLNYPKLRFYAVVFLPSSEFTGKQIILWD